MWSVGEAFRRVLRKTRRREDNVVITVKARSDTLEGFRPDPTEESLYDKVRRMVGEAVDP